MNDDPDLDAMAQSPIASDNDDVEMRDTTVIEGGASGGLFMPDTPSDGENDDALERARQYADAMEGEGAASETLSGEEMMAGLESGSDDSEDEAETDDEGDDPIVKTYDIYATKRLADHLYLFQYPIRPPNRPYEYPEQPVEARMKPRSGHIEIEIPIPETDYYDQQRATRWTDEPLKRQTIGGTITKGRNYLIGVMRGDELHVTPLKGIAQLRPTFKYIDTRDSEDKEVKRSDAAAERAPRAARAVQVSAKSSDAVPDLSTTALIRAAEEENWTRLQWRDSDNTESRSVFNHMLTTKKDIFCESLTDKAQYLDMLSTVKAPVSETPKSTKVKKDGRV